jgi:hypothetical protein
MAPLATRLARKALVFRLATLAGRIAKRPTRHGGWHVVIVSNEDGLGHESRMAKVNDLQARMYKMLRR